ncbi:flagellar hook capping FlgD N-terminal domain-containing protein [Hydrogenophaga aquatica]
METLLSGASAANATSGASGNAAVAPNGDTSNMFLTLLVAQIRNQDPLNPQDSSEYVNQLNQLSQTQALQQLVSQNNANATMLEGLQVLAMGAQVGSQLSVQVRQIELGTEPVAGSFTLASGSTQTTLVLTGADGLPRKVELGPRTAGAVNFEVDPVALGLPPGRYTIAVDAGEQPAPAVQVTGTLNSVRMSSTAGIVLDVAGVGSVSPADVTAFNGSRTSSQS